MLIRNEFWIEHFSMIFKMHSLDFYFILLLILLFMLVFFDNIVSGRSIMNHFAVIFNMVCLLTNKTGYIVKTKLFIHETVFNFHNVLVIWNKTVFFQTFQKLISLNNAESCVFWTNNWMLYRSICNELIFSKCLTNF